MIVGGTDGARAEGTRARVWSVEVSKRAILNSAIVRDNVAYITHGEENMDTTEMGMVAAVEPRDRRYADAPWARAASRRLRPPVMDAERL
jgi:hypothetical protein